MRFTPKQLFFPVLLFISIAVQAQERTDTEMLSIAKDKLTNTAFAKTTKKNVSHSTELRIVANDSQYSMYADNNGHGYVIVARNKAFSPVIGYGEEPFQDEISCCMRSCLDMINANLEARLENNELQEATGKDGATYEVVEPLLKTFWGQRSPYNLLCPKDGNGNTTYSGCVATAMAMVLNYFRYPSSVQAEGFYTLKTNEKDTIRVSIQSTYDWDNMLNTYTSSSGTTNQRNAVAQLMYDCGCAVGMNYGSTGSGASVTTAAKKFNEVFGYAAVNHTNKNYFSDYEWRQLVYDQLKAGCPLMHSGTDSNTNSGHAFVFDGVDADGLVHVNWGWGSSNHGYFDILALTPTNGSTKHNFSSGLGFIYNLKPKPQLEEGEEQEYQLVVGRGTSTYKNDYYTISIKDNRVILNTYGVFNWTPVPFKGYVGTRYESLDGGSNYNVRLKTPTGGYYVPLDVASRSSKSYGGYDANHDQTPSSIKPGRYKLFFAAYNDDKNNLKYRSPIRQKEEGHIYWILTVADDGTLSLSDKIIFDGPEDIIPSGIRMITSKGDNKNNHEMYNLNGQRVDSNYRGIVIINGRKLIKK